MHSHLVADRSNYWSNIIQDTWQWYEAAMDTDELEPPKIPVGKPDLELLRAAATPPKHRRPTKPSLGAKRRRMDGKRKRGNLKKTRGAVSAQD